MANQQVFREKSLERISSTEELRDYMRVTSPKLWMLLTVILVFLAGFIVFACFVTMENTIKSKATVYLYEDTSAEEPGAFNDIEIPIPDGMKDIVKRDMTVRLGGEEGVITMIFENQNGCAAVARLKDDSKLLKEGTYDAEIVIEKISPIKFLLN